MIGDSVFEVLLIRVWKYTRRFLVLHIDTHSVQFSVFALCAVTPICFLILPPLVFSLSWWWIWHYKYGNDSTVPWITIFATCYALFECLFFLGVYLPHKCRLQKVNSHLYGLPVDLLGLSSFRSPHLCEG